MELLGRARHGKKQIEEIKLQLNVKEEELDIKAALKISNARTKIIEEIERTELREKQLTEAFRLDLDQQPPMLVPITKTTLSQPPVPVLHSDPNSHAPLFTSQSISRSTAKQNWNTPVLTPTTSRNAPIDVRYILFQTYQQPNIAHLMHLQFQHIVKYFILDVGKKDG